MSFRRSYVNAGSLAAALLLIVAQPVAADSQGQPQAASTRFQTTRTFELDAGRATRTFTFRERSGVILVNRLTVLHGVRAFVDARIPHLAGARVSSWPSHNNPSLSCRRHGPFDVCTPKPRVVPDAAGHLALPPRQTQRSNRTNPPRLSRCRAAGPTLVRFPLRQAEASETEIDPGKKTNGHRFMVVISRIHQLPYLRTGQAEKA